SSSFSFPLRGGPSKVSILQWLLQRNGQTSSPPLLLLCISFLLSSKSLFSGTYYISPPPFFFSSLVPCRFGMCKTPIEVTTSQLMASELFPTYVVKVLLYPGAVANAIIKRRTLPRYSKLLKLYNISALRKSTAVSDLQRLEILAGSYLSVVGAFIGLSRRARMSLFGTMLIIWSLVRDIVLGQFHNMFPTKSIQMYPTLILAVVCAFLSIKKDVRKLIHSPRARRVKLS
ncbi:hypothetical protein Goklo_003920, partial [Gossypium klotzschianum]|nr:hypothetical protein [Gossypium klotzschianum]